MPLGMETGLGSGDFVFDGDPGTPWKKGKLTPRPILAHAPIVAKRLDGSRCHLVRLRQRCVTWGRSSPLKGAQPSPSFRFLSIVAICITNSHAHMPCLFRPRLQWRRDETQRLVGCLGLWRHLPCILTC